MVNLDHHCSCAMWPMAIYFLFLGTNTIMKWGNVFLFFFITKLNMLFWLLQFFLKNCTPQNISVHRIIWLIIRRRRVLITHNTAYPIRGQKHHAKMPEWILLSYVMGCQTFVNGQFFRVTRLAIKFSKTGHFIWKKSK